MTVRSGVDPIVGGYDTARVSAADNDQQRRAERDAAAVAWLTRHGHADLLPILGLAEPEGCANCGGPVRGGGDYCARRVCRTAERKAAR